MTKNNMKAEEIEEVLKGFTGTHHYYPNAAYSPDVHTDGVHWLAEVCEAFWLIDMIASHQGRIKVRKEEFQVWKLQVLENGKGILTCNDGNEDSPEVTRQIIPYTDFPLKEITLWLERGSLDVSYTDGPALANVEHFIADFHGATFDGMEDLKEYHISEMDGEKIRFANDFLFIERHFSEQVYQEYATWHNGFYGDSEIRYVEGRQMSWGYQTGYCDGDNDATRKMREYLKNTGF